MKKLMIFILLVLGLQNAFGFGYNDDCERMVSKRFTHSTSSDDRKLICKDISTQYSAKCVELLLTKYYTYNDESSSMLKQCPAVASQYALNTIHFLIFYRGYKNIDAEYIQIASEVETKEQEQCIRHYTRDYPAWEIRLYCLPKK